MKRKIILTVIGVFLLILVGVGLSYSFFSAEDIKLNNQTQTHIKAAELGLTFTGIEEINLTSMVPGNKDTKTFSVENTSNSALTYNIYLEGITNEFNDNLLYTLKDGTTPVIEDKSLPTTRTGKKYLLTNIEINAKETKTYTLIVEYKYSETENQSYYMGADFKATLGIDAEQNIEETSVYAVKRNIETTETTWTRLEESTGLIANAQIGTTTVQNNFDNIYPWSEIKSYNYDTNSKEITAWYGEEDFTFTPTDNVEVMTYIPEFYYKRVQDDTNEYVFISKENISGYTKSDAFSVGRYTMSGDSTRVHSRSGIAPLVSTTITDFRTYATNIGMQQLDYHYFILQLLYLVEYADYNSQNMLGVGNTSNTAAITSGECNDLGMKSGTLNNDGKHSVVYRGIEDIYGNIWQMVDGINIQDNQAYINYNPSTYAVDTFSGDYQKLGYINATTNGYITKLGYDANNSLISLPTAVGGSNSTYIPDDSWQNSGNRIARVGGAFNNKFSAGLWSWDMENASSLAWAGIGARLLMTS